MISFIMPAKNAADYIHEAIDPLRKVIDYEWELIVINDNSTDRTFEILKEYTLKDERIKVYNNIGSGKVKGLSYGYSKTKGDIIKCIDSDDVLLPDFFKEVNIDSDYNAHCHDSFVVNQHLDRIGAYYINAAYLRSNYQTVLTNLISLPRWTWSFKREIADQIFPLPSDLPFEDVWFALVIKKFAKIQYINKKLYLYRQHDNQTFGGILNYKKEIINFRAKRIIKLIRALASNSEGVLLDDISMLEYVEKYNLLMIDKFQFIKIATSDLKLIHKFKLILICFFPIIAVSITKWKWRFDRRLNN